MKFPYIPLDAILAEVATQFNTYNQQGTFDEDNAYNYAIEAAREIGMNNYDESTVGIPIRNHIGALPKDFYLVKEVWLANLVDSNININSIRDAFVIGTGPETQRNHLLHPGDSATVRFCCDKRTPFLNANTPSYTLKIPPGVIRTNVREGVVELNYFHLPKDERGVIGIQDEVNTIKCVKAYILMSMLKQDYIMQKLPRYIYKDIEDEFYTYLSQAKGLQKLPDPSTDKFHANALRNRYNPFKLN